MSRLLFLVLGLAIGSASRAETCPPPPPCPPPVDTTCDGMTETTITISTTSCFGDTPSETMTVEETVGDPNGVDICIGPEKSVGFFVCPGTVNSNFNTETVLSVGRIFADGFEEQ